MTISTFTPGPGFGTFAASNTPPEPTTVKGTLPIEGAPMTVEQDGNLDSNYRSLPSMALDPSFHNPGVGPLGESGKITPFSELMSVVPGNENYGRNIKINSEKDPTDKKKSAVTKAKARTDEQVPNNLKADNPTAAAGDPSKEIHDAIMDVDPSNIAGSIQKALHAMVMIKMMDKLASPAGIASMAAGALGGGLGGLAKAVGAGAMLGGLSAAMPALQGSLPGSHLGALNIGMQGMITGNPVGVLAAASVATAAQTVASITGAASVINPNRSINTAVYLGGPTLGLTPESLAYRIALSTPGATIKTSNIIKGVAVATTLEVVDSFMHDQLGVIPKLAGDEHIGIATAHIPVMNYGVGNAMVSTLHTAGLIGGEVAGAYLGGAVREITGNLANAVSGALGGGNIGGVLGNVMGGAIGGAISGGVSGIVDSGLNKLLGAPLGGMLGVAGKLVPNIAGSIGNVVNVHSIKGGLAAGAISGAMNEATKALGLASSGFKITKVFGPGLAEQVSDMHDSMVGKVVENVLAGAIKGAVSSALANSLRPTTMTAYTNGVRITVRAQTIATPAQAAVVGAIAGAFSQL